MSQDRPACIGRPPLKALQGLPTVSAQYRILRRQAAGNCAGGHHRYNSGYSGAASVGVGGAKRGRLHQTTALAAAVWGNASQTTE